MDALLYIFIEISTYLYGFQRVTMLYIQISEKRSVLIFFKKADGNAYGKSWLRVLKQHNKYQKPKLTTLNEYNCSFLSSDWVQH